MGMGDEPQVSPIYFSAYTQDCLGEGGERVAGV